MQHSSSPFLVAEAQGGLRLMQQRHRIKLPGSLSCHTENSCPRGSSASLAPFKWQTNKTAWWATKIWEEVCDHSIVILVWLIQYFLLFNFLGMLVLSYWNDPMTHYGWLPTVWESFLQSICHISSPKVYTQGELHGGGRAHTSATSLQGLSFLGSVNKGQSDCVTRDLALVGDAPGTSFKGFWVVPLPFPVGLCLLDIHGSGFKPHIFCVLSIDLCALSTQITSVACLLFKEVGVQMHDSYYYTVRCWDQKPSSWMCPLLDNQASLLSINPASLTFPTLFPTPFHKP